MSSTLEKIKKEHITFDGPLKVIGWTSWDNTFYEDFDDNDTDPEEAFDAVVREVRNNKYLFSGEDHQDYGGCCPVLSNGTVYKTSCRGWDRVIDQAYDGKYSGYMSMFIPKDKLKRPEKSIDTCDIIEFLRRKIHYLPTYGRKNDNGLVLIYVCTESKIPKDVKIRDCVFLTSEDKKTTYKYYVLDVMHTKTLQEMTELLSDDYSWDFYGASYGYGDVYEFEEYKNYFYKYFTKEDEEKNGIIALILRAIPCG